MSTKTKFNLIQKLIIIVRDRVGYLGGDLESPYVPIVAAISGLRLGGVFIGSEDLNCTRGVKKK